MGKSEDSHLDVSSEKGKTKISLCKLLSQNKTKVGCFKTDSEEDRFDDSFINMNPSMPSSSFNKKSRNLLRKTITRGYSDPETNTTRLTLCCAVTESSHTPPHSHFHTSIQSGGIPENESRVIQTRDFGSQTIDSSIVSPDNKLPKSFGREESEKKKAEMKNESPIAEVHKSGIECRLSRPPSNDSVKFVDDDDEVEDEEEEVLSSASSNSLWLCKNESTPKMHCGKRLSMENLVSSTFSARHSSPDSVKSVPEMKDRRRRLSQDTSITKENKNVSNSLACPDETHQISMDSLAKQSLLAAQVLHLIPTEKARERNFLQGRIGANSLLGTLELDKVLPKREIKIFVGTWNMNGEPPPQELNDFMLPNGLEHIPDIIAVGTQESTPERFDWEVKIQETIGPSHVLFHSSALGTIHLAIFLRRDLLWYCSVPEESSQSVRPGMAFRTKGAVAIAFILFGTSYLFITSHLTAHQDKVKERIHDVKRIVRSLDLPKNLPLRHRTKNKDVTQNFDCVFWFGDLNFRLAQPREDVLHWVEEYKFPLLVDLKADQLKKLILDGTCLSTFQEGSITFPPTYKYDVGTQNFDTSSKQRTPAYTDRILFKSKGGNLSCVTYSSVPTICTSDHKPVWGVYKGMVRPGIDTIPLSAGLFNREVYLEGIKRRAADLDKREMGLAAFCSVQ